MYIHKYVYVHVNFFVRIYINLEGKQVNFHINIDYKSGWFQII